MFHPHYRYSQTTTYMEGFVGKLWRRSKVLKILYNRGMFHFPSLCGIGCSKKWLFLSFELLFFFCVEMSWKVHIPIFGHFYQCLTPQQVVRICTQAPYIRKNLGIKHNQTDPYITGFILEWWNYIQNKFTLPISAMFNNVWLHSRGCLFVPRPPYIHLIGIIQQSFYLYF